MQSASLFIKVGARASRLSREQVREVHLELLKYRAAVFQLSLIETTGDRDKATSLRDLGKTDFFTHEIDEAQLQGHFRIAIHSAKDLPEVLRPGLRVVALTRGVDPYDLVVYNRELPCRAVIGVSSRRREEMVYRWRGSCRCVDIRGTIEERLALLDSGCVDAVVMAQAAIIRLRLERQSIRLPGEVAPLQGRLAIVALSSDREMEQIFQPLHWGGGLND